MQQYLLYDYLELRYSETKSAEVPALKSQPLLRISLSATVVNKEYKVNSRLWFVTIKLCIHGTVYTGKWNCFTLDW